MIEIIVLLLSVLIGVLLIQVLKPKKNTVALLLTFSGAYLLSITILKLFPEIFTKGDKNIGLFIILGLLIQLVLDFFSKGVEHGHFHAPKNQSLPWALFVSITIHAFMEGLPINEGHHLHYSYFYGILIHKLPIAIVLTTLMLQAGLKKTQVFTYLLIFAAMSPMAAYIGNRFDFMLVYGKYINAFVIGILAHIGTTILFENEHSHRFNLRKFLLIFIAMTIAYFS